MTTLEVAGRPVATYVEHPDLDIRLAPRPYLHPVRTLSGITVTDALCYDHPWHMGASVTIADVDGRNFWGGRTYVRDRGYVWLDDHGRVVQTALSPRPGGFTASLEWRDAEGEVLLREQRSVTASAAPHGWRLSFAYALSTVTESPVLLGSPATHGRPGQAGYGGFFWRGAPGPATAFGPLSGARQAAGDPQAAAAHASAAPHASAGLQAAATAQASAGPHGSADPWLALTAGDRCTLVFQGLAGADRWFARTEEYVGVCAALAFTDPLPITLGNPLTRTIHVLVADGTLTRAQVEEALYRP